LTKGSTLPARPESDTYQRPISAREWLLLAHPRGLVTDIQLCVEGEGRIDADALAAAVATVAEAGPSSRLTRRGRHWVASGRIPPVRVTEAATFDRQRLDSPLLHASLTRGKPATCEVVLVQGSPCTVVFRANHGVMDAHGARLWQQQVFRALRGEPVKDAPSRLTTDEIMTEIAARAGEELPPVRPVSRQPWRSPLGPQPGRPRHSLWRRRRIDGQNPAATAHILRQLVAHEDQSGLILVPVDLRAYLPGLQTTGMAIGDLKMAVHDGDDWSDLHARLLQALAGREFLRNRADPSVLRMPLPVLRAVLRSADAKAARDPDFLSASGFSDVSACVSHLGVVDLTDFRTAEFEPVSYYCLGGADFAPEIIVVESAGQTELTLAWREGPGTAEAAEGLLDRIEEALSPRRYRDWDGNHTARDVPAATLTGLFAEQVARTPAALAVTGPDGDLTYAELNERANAVATALRARGIGREDRVGLVAGRSAAVIAAVWGTLKAGAAYVPIDPGYPDAPAAQILTAADVRVCLLEPAAVSRDLLPPGCAGVSLGALPPAEPGWQDADVRPGDLAYVVYTSGSTGAPKGVEVEHRTVVNYADWAIRAADIDASTLMLLTSSTSFDVAGCSYFLPLLAGGAVRPVPEVNAVTLRDVLENSGATVMAVTPSHLDLIGQAGVQRSTMRVVMTIGELLRRSTALRAREVLGPQCRILNQWGPTETTVVNTSHEFDPAADTDLGVPIGRPMDNNTLHLLDAHRRFVAPGEPGEIYVGGAQVARGYLGQADLTRERFVHLADGTRVYRTGDIARLLPSGDLTFISRIDDQVKIAGHRVEPAEVTQTLESHPRVRQAAVIPRSRPGQGQKTLCGYAVTDDDGPDGNELKEFLAARLPPYMIPAAIITVPEIPRNSNGKMDKSKLPDPFAEAAAVPGGMPADRDEVTAMVAAIWARILQVQAHLLDEQTDFHQLGGNSVLLLSMVSEVGGSIAESGQQQFMDQLGQIIREPTLGRVSQVVREIEAGHPVR
jgi:amino acid adenylation domain-containing protein